MIILNHFPRRFGKTHLLIDKALSYLYNNKNKNILIISNNIKTIYYIHDIINCNLINDTKLIRKGKNYIILSDKNIDSNLIITNYNFLNSIKNYNLQIKIKNYFDYIFIDEFLYESNIKSVKKLLSLFKENIEINIYYTSNIGPFHSNIFKYITNKKNITLKKLIKKYSKKLNLNIIKNEFNKINNTLYTSDIKFKIKNNMKINYYENSLYDIINNKKINKNIYDKLDRIYYNSTSNRLVNVYGTLFWNKNIIYRDRRIFNNFNKIKIIK